MGCRRAKKNRRSSGGEEERNIMVRYNVIGTLLLFLSSETLHSFTEGNYSCNSG